MHFELKSISEQSIPEALAKVERYRLLNEPSLAESICLDPNFPSSSAGF